MPGSAASAGPATALIRPENFFLGASSASYPAIDVTVEQIVYVGSSFELFGRTASGRKLVAQIPVAQRAEVGALDAGRAARWHYDPASVHVIAERKAA